jgi:cytochrome c-type protein NapC
MRIFEGGSILFRQERKKSRLLRLFWLLIILGVLATIATISWIVVDKTLHVTSDHQFCGSCHSMKPMQASFLEDTHGGNSVMGVQALCTDCHLPQDSYIDYLYMKAKNGAWDVYKEHILGAGDVDWHAKRLQADRYTYDSGCLKCHNNLEQASEISNKQFVAHKPYFQKTSQKTCIACHNVGHKELERFLNAE